MADRKCWSCGCSLPEHAHFKVDFLAVSLCNSCECKQRSAQNRIRLPEWSEAFRKLAESRKREQHR